MTPFSGRLSVALQEYFWTNKGRPINKWVRYLPIYERYFAPFRNRRIVFLEIGTGQGGSSQMWKHYFGPAADIVTIDIRPECAAFADEQVSVRTGDQSDPAFLKSIVDEFGAPDIVLDDGSHVMEHVNATFRFLYPQMMRDAIYMVEDMHTAYWPNWNGGLRKPGTFIEEMKNLVDELHGGPLNETQNVHDVPVSEISKLTRAVHFYPSIVVVEKGAFVNKEAFSIPFVEGQTIW